LFRTLDKQYRRWEAEQKVAAEKGTE
jgi:hypothetical protein